MKYKQQSRSFHLRCQLSDITCTICTYDPSTVLRRATLSGVLEPSWLDLRLRSGLSTSELPSLDREGLDAISYKDTARVISGRSGLRLSRRLYDDSLDLTEHPSGSFLSASGVCVKHVS